jgi:hypothetical protein
LAAGAVAFTGSAASTLALEKANAEATRIESNLFIGNKSWRKGSVRRLLGRAIMPCLTKD